MPRYVAFLRAINVGGARTVKMEVLRRIFESLGFARVATYIASGNVLFDSPGRSARVLEDRIEAALMGALGYEVTPFVRNRTELARIAAFEPFPGSTVGPKDQLGVIFLCDPLRHNLLQNINAVHTLTDELRAEGREIYWLRHRIPGAEVYSTVAFDKLLDQPFSIRTTGTVRKLVEIYDHDVRK